MKQSTSAKWTYTTLAVLDYVLVSCFLIIVVIFKLLSLPFQMLRMFMNVRFASQDNEAMEVKLINLIRGWVVNHENDLVDATESFGKQESYFAKISPKNEEAATLDIEIGYPRYLRVSMNNYGIEFDEDEIDQGEQILHDILLSYENGKYYLKKWYYKGQMVEKCLVIELENGKRYVSKVDEFKLLRKVVAKEKIKKFLPIASLEVS
ncbi:MAG TPA: hypothetical protein PLD88_05510 [Candidatus Berkiella sp.]|nr:hypothetical protein [Candidatus Berkiella sp.]